MITPETLKRMPGFAAVRENMRDVLKVRGAAWARDMLEHGVWECWDKPILDWILDTPDYQTTLHRVEALMVVIREWESES